MTPPPLTPVESAAVRLLAALDVADLQCPLGQCEEVWLAVQAVKIALWEQVRDNQPRARPPVEMKSPLEPNVP